MTKEESTLKLGKLIKSKRVRCDITQQTLAELADTSLQYIGEIERGKKVPGYFTLVKIIEALHIDPRDIFPYCIEKDSYLCENQEEDLLQILSKESKELKKEELILIINFILILKRKDRL